MASFHSCFHHTGETDPGRITRGFFNHHLNPVRSLRMRVVYSYMVKLLYLIANIVAFCCTDRLLNGNFAGYGEEFCFFVL